MPEKERIQIKGQLTDEQSRCTHYHSPLDIIAIRMHCCDTYYACIECHNEIEAHISSTWPASVFHTKAVLCGACKFEMTINEYLASNNECPKCKAGFNPGCSNHYHFYFEMG